ncbi:MAG: alpha/beta hydrolase [Bacillota bacterium]|nr:alpha/beta hydrolase [Bacillota bacterium]
MWILWLVLALLLLLLLFLFALLYIGIFRWPRRFLREGAPSWAEEKWVQRIREGSAWMRQQQTERICIKSYDGLRLVGLFLPAELPEPKGSIILVHGWHSNGYDDFSCAYRFYHELGYNILNIFQRAHGESQGCFTCFGVKERYDCQGWARYMAERFGEEHDLFFSGISMGASSVMMASSLELPGSVRGLVADCGFTSAWEQFSHVLTRHFHLPAHPILELADLLCRCIAGFGFRDCSCPEALSQNQIPVLFVHGLADHFVPAHMSQSCYDACAAPKELVLVEGAGHGFSFLVEEERVSAKIKDFLKKWGTKE